MNKLPSSKRAQILQSLTEGVSIRGTARLVGVSKTTVLKLLVEVGEFCEHYQDRTLRNLPCKAVQADEIWAFVGAKPKHTENPGFGDAWTFTAMDADSKLIVSWLVGNRTIEYAHAFMKDVASRLASRVQLTTDGHYMYLSAVEEAFGWDGVDYAMLVKRYASADARSTERRYSPPVCTGTAKKWVMGQPVKELVSTSYVERSNLTLRLMSRRFTRLTNAFSKKLENHTHAVALHFFAYNFCRPHQTLTKRRKGIKTTPAMAAGLTSHPWKMEELLGLMEAEKSKA